MFISILALAAVYKLLIIILDFRIIIKILENTNTFELVHFAIFVIISVYRLQVIACCSFIIGSVSHATRSIG